MQIQYPSGTFTRANIALSATAESEGTVHTGTTDVDWTSFTPTGFWTTNTTYTGAWRREGQNMHIVYGVSISGGQPNNSVLNLNMPSGYTIDNSSFDYGVIGGEAPSLNSTGGSFDAGSGYADGNGYQL